MFNCQNKICDGSKINFKGVFIDEKHLQKCLFEEKVCNLVTEISSKETGGYGAEYKCYFKRKIIEQTEEDFLTSLFLEKKKMHIVSLNQSQRKNALSFSVEAIFLDIYVNLQPRQDLMSGLWMREKNFPIENGFLMPKK